MLFRAQPKTELSKFINAYKSASSRLLKQEYPHRSGKDYGESISGAVASACSPRAAHPSK